MDEIGRILTAIKFNIESLSEESEVDDFPDVDTFVARTRDLIDDALALLEKEKAQ